MDELGPRGVLTHWPTIVEEEEEEQDQDSRLRGTVVPSVIDVDDLEFLGLRGIAEPCAILDVVEQPPAKRGRGGLIFHTILTKGYSVGVAGKIWFQSQSIWFQNWTVWFSNTFKHVVRTPSA